MYALDVEFIRVRENMIGDGSRVVDGVNGGEGGGRVAIGYPSTFL